MLYRAWSEGWGPKFYTSGSRAALLTARVWSGSVSAKPRPTWQGLGVLNDWPQFQPSANSNFKTSRAYHEHDADTACDKAPHRR